MAMFRSIIVDANAILSFDLELQLFAAVNIALVEKCTMLFWDLQAWRLHFSISLFEMPDFYSCQLSVEIIIIEVSQLKTIRPWGRIRLGIGSIESIEGLILIKHHQLMHASVQVYIYNESIAPRNLSSSHHINGS